MFQLSPLLAVGAVTLCIFQHALAAWYIVTGAFAIPAKLAFTSFPCKRAPDSKAYDRAGVLATQIVCVCAVNSFSANKLYNNVRILKTFIWKLLKCKSRFYVVQFLIIYIYFSSVLTSFCWLTKCLHHYSYNKHVSRVTFPCKTVIVLQRNKKKQIRRNVFKSVA